MLSIDYHGSILVRGKFKDSIPDRIQMVLKIVSILVTVTKLQAQIYPGVIVISLQSLFYILTRSKLVLNYIYDLHN